MEDQPKEKIKFLDIIKSNLKIITSTIFLLLVLISFYSWFEYKEDIKKKNLSEKFIEAKIMLSQKKNDQALNILKNIIEEEDNTYSVLSLYLIIDQNLEKNDKKIINYFDKILSNSNLENEDLDLVKFKKAIFISSYSDEKEMLDLLNPKIKVINVSDKLFEIYQNNKEKTYFYKYDGHYNINGYKKVSEIIGKELSRLLK